ncbi:MAG: ankyrin repeat domain-containing protein [Archangium sp.]|nr:ankyrin repeat domain-containing protein [Archangium sp.]
MTLYEAVETGDVEQVKAALAMKPDVNMLGPDKRTPLIEAAGQGALEIVKLLLAAGAEPRCRDAHDETALLRAAANGHLEVARALSPHAEDEERELARSFLAAAGLTAEQATVEEEVGLKRKAVEFAARAAGFVGHDDALGRVARVERAEKNAKKK